MAEPGYLEEESGTCMMIGILIIWSSFSAMRRFMRFRSSICRLMGSSTCRGGELLREPCRVKTSIDYTEHPIAALAKC